MTFVEGSPPKGKYTLTLIDTCCPISTHISKSTAAKTYHVGPKILILVDLSPQWFYKCYLAICYLIDYFVYLNSKS